MKNYQTPTVSMICVSSEDVIATSGTVQAGGAGNLSNMHGIDFGNW